DGKAQALEEEFGLGRKGCAARDKGPETKTEKPMNATEPPGAAEERLGFGSGIIFIQPFAPATRIDFAFDSGTHKIEHARHRDKNRGAFAFHGAKNFAGIGRVFENDRRAKQ